MVCRAVALLASFLVVVISVGVASAEEPSAALSVNPDLGRGGSLFTLDLFNLNLNESEDGDITLYIFRDGTPVFDDPYDDAIYVECPLVTTPENVVKNSCSFFLYAANLAGTYTADIYINPRDVSLLAEATFAADIPRWWNQFTVVKKETSRFTGNTDLIMTFDSVPVEVNTLDLSYWSDTDYDGNPDQQQGSIQCTLESENGGTRQFLCAKDRIPPLCIHDDFGNRFCDDSDYGYYFYANNIPIAYNYEAILYRLSRYEEGQFFGRTNFNSGMPLQDFFDLDTFRYQSPEPCSYQNSPHCYDVGYYDTWTALYRAGFANLMGTQGRFESTGTGSGISVSTSIPLLPIGANGFRAAVAYGNVNDASNSGEMDLTCREDGCDSILIQLPPGTYQLTLKVYNNHPAITIYDFDGNEIMFGQTPFTNYPLSQTVTVQSGSSRLKTSKIMLDPRPVPAGEAVLAKVRITSPGSGGNHMAGFDWGGGVQSAVTVGPAGMAASQHVYNHPGIYKVRVKVTNDAGETFMPSRALVFVVAPNGKKIRLVSAAAGNLFLSGSLKQGPPGNYSGEIRARIKGKYFLRFQSTGINQLWFFRNWAFATGTGVTVKGVKVGWDISVVDGALTSDGQDLVRLVIFKAGKRSKVLYDSQRNNGRYQKPNRPLTKGNVAIKYT